MGKPKPKNRRHSGQKSTQEHPVKGKLGKPQRSNKHKKLKSVDFQAGWASLAVGNFGRRIKNLPPLNDEQEIPKSVMRLNHKAYDLDPERKRKKKQKKKGDHNISRPAQNDGNAVSEEFKFVQGRRESDRAFFNRMECVTQREIIKAQVEEKYDVEITESKDGTKVVKHRSEQKKKKDKERKAKKKAKKTRIREDEQEVRKDEVKFGEVVMEPPSHLKRKNAEVGANAGKRDLLLNELFRNSCQPGPSTVATKQSRLVTREVGHTVKRKLLSPAAKFKVDQARENAIQMYRQLKKSASRSGQSTLA